MSQSAPTTPSSNRQTTKPPNRQITKIKLCGIRDADILQGLIVEGLPIDYVGLVKVRASPRYVNPEEVAELLGLLRQPDGSLPIQPVLLFQDRPLHEAKAVVLALRNAGYGAGGAAARRRGR